MYEELVRLLKDKAGSFDYDGWVDTAVVMEKSADAIEELAGFVQEAERDRDEYRERLDKANDAIEELQRRLEQALYMPLPLPSMIVKFERRIAVQEADE